MKKEIIVGFLTIVILASGVVYISLPKEVKLFVDNDKSTFYVYDNRWLVGGREFNLLFDGTSKLYRDLSSIKINTTIDGNKTTITKLTKYIRGVTIKDTYIYFGNISNKELFPINHRVEIFNGTGYFYRYEVKDLVYDGITKGLVGVQHAFGRNMKVTWDDGYRWARVYKSGILKVQYDIPTDYESFNVKLYDPETIYSNDRNLGDASINELVPTTNFGDNIYLSAQETVYTNNILIVWNLTGIDSNFEEAELRLYLIGNLLDDETEGYNISAHRVFSNYSWSELNISWSTRPNASSHFNSTYSDKLIFFGGDSEPFYWQNWTVTSIIKDAIAKGELNVSIYLRSFEKLGSPSSGEFQYFVSRNYTIQTSYRPRLVLTYATIEPVNITNLKNTSTEFYSSLIEWNTSGSANYSLKVYNDSARTKLKYSSSSSSYSASRSINASGLNTGITHYVNLSVWNTEGNLTQNNTFSFKTKLNSRPNITNLKASPVDNDSAWINWNCNENCNYTLKLYNNSARTSTYLEKSYANNTFKTFHNKSVTSLKQLFTYYLTLQVWDNLGETRINNTYSFTTQGGVCNFFLYLDELNESRNYEYETTAKIEGGCGLYVTVYDNTNRYINQTGEFDYLIDILRDSPKDDTVADGSSFNITFNKEHDLYNFTFNINASQTTNDLLLTVENEKIAFPGNLTGNELTQTEFIFGGNSYSAYNFSAQTADTLVFYINFSAEGKPERIGYFNFTLGGEALNKDNAFSYDEKFKETTYNYSHTLDGTYSPIGRINGTQVWETFSNNATNDRWEGEGTFLQDSYAYCKETTPLRYLGGDNDCLWHRCVTGCDGTYPVMYQDYIDLSQIERFSISTSDSCRCNCINRFEFTDLSNTVTIHQTQQSGCAASYDYNSCNYTFQRKSQNIWTVSHEPDPSGHCYAGDLDVSSLDAPYYVWIKAYAGSSQDTTHYYWRRFVFQSMNIGGISLNKTNYTYWGREGPSSSLLSGNWTSHTINDTASNIGRAILSYSTFEPTGTNITPYLSNDNGVTFEAVINGTSHLFDSSGDKIKARFHLESNDNVTSPFVLSYSVDVISSALTDVAVDIGNNGDYEANIGYELNETTSPWNFTANDSAINDYIFANQDTNILVPVALILESGGTLNLYNLNLTEDINPVNITPETVQYIDEFSIVQDNKNNKPIEFRDVKLDYNGNKDIAVQASSAGNATSITYLIKAKYSNFGLSFPSGADYWEIFPSKRNQSGIEPFGQNDTHGVWQVDLSNIYHTEGIDIYARYNESIDSCVVNMTFVGEDGDSETNNTINLSTAYQLIVGNLSTSSASFITEGWEDGPPIDNNVWLNTSSSNKGRIRVLSDYFPNTGSYHVCMDVSATGTNNRNELKTNFDLAGYVNLTLDFSVKEFNDENTNCNPSWTGAMNGDCIGMTCDNYTWYNLYNLTDDYDDYTNISLDLSDPIYNYCGGITNSSFAVVFKQYDNYPLETDGICFDDISFNLDIGSANIWTYTDILCSGYSSNFIIPYFCFMSICSTCVRTSDYLETSCAVYS